MINLSLKIELARPHLGGTTRIYFGMQLITKMPNSGLYSIWQACTLIWTVYLSELFVGTKLPQIVI